jgi:hypothetical protein
MYEDKVSGDLISAADHNLDCHCEIVTDDKTLCFMPDSQSK